jgi:hypothetical protein
VKSTTATLRPCAIKLLHYMLVRVKTTAAATPWRVSFRF